ncbi:MAG: Gamma-L-glutamyl-butirosin B gamma-glutamyl cyclotransferase [Burkholderia plantarii]|nr:MAG: Gamma-L-glutamyl-butirosin B gamma-glutamyl cyclotransferase [Burkholderia plantarii]
MRHVFVYGTLRAGEINDIGLAAARHGIAAPELVGSGTLAGTLYDFGSYPGMVAGQDGHGGHGDHDGAARVSGDVYAIDERLVPVLDEIEEVVPGVDGLFMSRETRVELAGRHYDCLFYPVAAHSVADRPRIAGGDWIDYRLARARAGALVTL